MTFTIIRWRRVRMVAALVALSLATAVLATSAATAAESTAEGDVVMLTADDFVWGTYIIDEPGTYMLAEDISFNPNSPATLTAAVQSGTIPAWLAGALGLSTPVDAYSSGFPLFTQLLPGGTDDFDPGGPLAAQYDPAAYGVGFFAAIAVTADDVVLDLNGHTIEQSREHALLQRFFSVIELADQPFISAQGPHDFGSDVESATNVTITNGTIGRSSHHGIHGNGNENVTITDIDFVDYEVGAVALNGVKGLEVANVTAENRKDVPVLGTFSSGQFIKHYINELARNGSATTLTVAGNELDVSEIQGALRNAINNVHDDIVVHPNIVDHRAQIDALAHPDEYALFHNEHGLVDGNSYSFVVNNLGVAVNGFPWAPEDPAEDIVFRNVHVVNQRAAINEVPAVDAGGSAAIDPVGAVFQTHNLDPATGEPVTVSHIDDALAEYTGNVVANAQAFVAKAAANGEFATSNLDVSRLNLPDHLIKWIEAAPGYETLADAGVSYYCNGDSMFHVNKGAIAFKIDAARDVKLVKTTVNGLDNFGAEGSSLCGDYLDGHSHPAATLKGYSGSTVRAYTFAGSEDVVVRRSTVRGLHAMEGSALGFDILTDSTDIKIVKSIVDSVDAGWGYPMPADSPTATPYATGFYIAETAGSVKIVKSCATDLTAQDYTYVVDDRTGQAKLVKICE